MKTNHLINLVAATVGLAFFPSTGCAENAKIDRTSLPPASDGATTTVTTTIPGSTAVQVAAAASAAVAETQWGDIKDYNYELRAQFFAGLDRLKTKLDIQIRELVAKRATMTGTTDTKDWDIAMKEMGDARTYLKSMGEDLAKATRETWDQAKDKVGQAWVRTQEARSKVKSSTTS